MVSGRHPFTCHLSHNTGSRPSHRNQPPGTLWCAECPCVRCANVSLNRTRPFEPVSIASRLEVSMGSNQGGRALRPDLTWVMTVFCNSSAVAVFHVPGVLCACVWVFVCVCGLLVWCRELVTTKQTSSMGFVDHLETLVFEVAHFQREPGAHSKIDHQSLPDKQKWVQ